MKVLRSSQKMAQSKLKTKPGWRSRGYLPHYDGGEIAQFITTRLCDSMPREVLERWRIELEKEELLMLNFEKGLSIISTRDMENVI